MTAEYEPKWRDTFHVNIHTTIGWRDRFKILLGRPLLQHLTIPIYESPETGGLTGVATTETWVAPLFPPRKQQGMAYEPSPPEDGE